MQVEELIRALRGRITTGAVPPSSGNTTSFGIVHRWPATARCHSTATAPASWSHPGNAVGCSQVSGTPGDPNPSSDTPKALAANPVTVERKVEPTQGRVSAVSETGPAGPTQLVATGAAWAGQGVASPAR